MAKNQISAATRVQRLLAILQWAARHPEGVSYDELGERFGVTDRGLMRDLEMAAMIGADSVHYDEMPFEVILEDDRVFVRLFSFDRPMRITPAEGLALVGAADALAGDDPDGPLGRALAKLAALLGIRPGETVEVNLDPEGGPKARFLREAVEAQQKVRFTYWTYGRDVVGVRDVSPWEIFSSQGSWYLAAGIDDGSQRNFRLDRMEDLIGLADRADPAPVDLDTSLELEEDLPLVELDIPVASGWLVDTHPVVSVEPGLEGRMSVVLAIAGSAWLERLLLRLGPEARVVSIDPRLGDTDVAAKTAERLLDRYRSGTPAR